MLTLDCHWIGNGLEKRIGYGLAVEECQLLGLNRRSIGIRLTRDWKWIGSQLGLDWHFIGTQLALDWHRIDSGLTLYWYSIGTGLTSD